MQRKTEILLFRWFRPHHAIIFMVTSVFLAIICGYAISVGTGKVNALLPYISYTGAEPPASCVFGFLLNIGGFFGIICVYIRHRHLENGRVDNAITHMINDISMTLGLLTCFGMMVIACFQITTASFPHFIGAFMIYILGNVYCVLQSYLSYVTIGIINTTGETFIRIIISASASLCYVFTCMLGNIATSKAKGAKVKEICRWDSNDPGYSAHLGSTFSQWIMTICLLLFFLSFYHEFKNIECKVHINNKMREDSNLELPITPARATIDDGEDSLSAYNT